MTAKATKAVDYSTYSFKRLFKELDSTSEKIANLQGKKAQIEQALRQKSEIPNYDTIKAMQECERTNPNDDIVEVGKVSNYLKGLVSNG